MADRPNVWDRFRACLPENADAVAPQFSWGPADEGESDGISLSEWINEIQPDLVVAHSRGAYEVLNELVAARSTNQCPLVLLGWANQSPETSAAVVPRADDELLDMCRAFIVDRMRAEGSPSPSAIKLDWLAKFLMRRVEGWDRRVWIRPEALMTYQYPVLMVVGERDRTLALSDVEALTAGLPDAEATVLADCGHWPMLERPDLLAHAVLGFASRAV